jgi:hypothetical protein
MILSNAFVQKDTVKRTLRGQMKRPATAFSRDETKLLMLPFRAVAKHCWHLLVPALVLE